MNALVDRLSPMVAAVLMLSPLYARDGSIAGIVRDQATQQPLIGANVMVEDTPLGAAIDRYGQFIISQVPVGSYNVKATVIGYEPEVKLSVQVVPEREILLTFDLPLGAIEMEAVRFSYGYFKKDPDVFTSSRTVDLEEIRNDPGGIGDVQRMMQTLPAVGSAGGCWKAARPVLGGLNFRNE